MIIVGLGPAGMALGYRAHQQGLSVLGIDPNPGWSHTIGIWADEIPHWMPPVGGHPVRPRLRTRRGERVLHREYVIVDGAALSEKLATFPIITAAAHITSPTTVTAEGHTHTASTVIDTRGIPHLRLPSMHPTPEPTQFALGVFLPHDQAGEFAGANMWMDFQPADPADHCAPDTFLYAFDTPQGVLVEETVLVADSIDAETLRRRLRQRLTHGGVDPEVLDTHPSEDVAIPMRPHHHMGAGIGFGIRAGLVTPISGYSVGTAWKLIDDLLLARNTAHSPLPWQHRSWKVDQWLTTTSLDVLRALARHPGATREFFSAVLSLPEKQLWDLLTPGNPIQSARAMLNVFVHLRPAQRRIVITALANHLRPARKGQVRMLLRSLRQQFTTPHRR